MQDLTYDIIIIGGGINGCGIARDAAGRGLKVALFEMGDLAQGTSSASTKLIHGGLRYLEHYAFGLVRDALREREVLMGIAPHIVSPMRFVLPHAQGMRPAWMLRLGLFLYDHIGGRKILPATQTLDLRTHAAGAALKAGFSRGFEYSDCRVDDARLVVLNAMDAASRGADIFTRTRVISARREGDLWRVEAQYENAPARGFYARALVNAGGAWVDEIARICGSASVKNVRLVQGSHIVVAKLCDHELSYIFQHRDGRIVFAIPFEQKFTLIGTTDHDFTGDPLSAHASDSEITYLLEAAAEYFSKPPVREDVVWSFSGVRALYNEGRNKQAAKDATREYVLALDSDGPPLLHVYGGKITTYRTLAEAALAKLQFTFPAMPGKSWTGTAPLPGGDLPAGGRDELTAELQARFPWLGADMLRRMIGSYGTLSSEILSGAAASSDLGIAFGAGLYEREVRWLMQREWARTAEDVLWRRTKLGLRFAPAQRDVLARFMARG